jgi:hypothetical protein
MHCILSMTPQISDSVSMITPENEGDGVLDPTNGQVDRAADSD